MKSKFKQGYAIEVKEVGVKSEMPLFRINIDASGQYADSPHGRLAIVGITDAMVRCENPLSGGIVEYEFRQVYLDDRGNLVRHYAGASQLTRAVEESLRSSPDSQLGVDSNVSICRLPNLLER